MNAPIPRLSRLPRLPRLPCLAFSDAMDWTTQKSRIVDALREHLGSGARHGRSALVRWARGEARRRSDGSVDHRLTHRAAVEIDALVDAAIAERDASAKARRRATQARLRK
jgi:hypothetical protein